MSIPDDLHHDGEAETTLVFKASTVLSMLVGLCILLIGGLAYWQWDTVKSTALHREQVIESQRLQDIRIQAIEVQVKPLSDAIPRVESNQQKIMSRQNQVLQKLQLKPVD